MTRPTHAVRPSWAALAVAGLVITPATAVAQAAPSVKQLDKVVVTAARTPQLAEEAMGDITVISQQELAQAGQNSVAEILARQPGIQITTNGGPQTVTGVSLRGANPNQTLVLLNGMRINGSVQGGVNWNAIDPASIQRIEILRGAASSLYGADAIGGVINIITQDHTQDRPTQFYGSVGVGTYRTTKNHIGIDGAQNGLSYNLNLSYAKSNGFNASNPRSGSFTYYRDKDGYHSNSINGGLAYEWAQDQRLGFNAYSSYINGDFDAGDMYPDAFTQTRQQSYNLYSTNRINDYWHSTLTVGLSKEQNTTPIYGNAFSTLQRQYSWQNDFTLTDNQSLSLIAERLEERIAHNTTAYRQTDRNTNSFAGIYRADFGPHHLQASLRNDNISGLGNRTTGGLGYELDVDSHWTVGAAGNTGFRAPTFTDLYSPLDFGFQGNPNLKPEKSKNIEAHIAYDDGQSQFKVTAFQNKIRNLIDPYVCDANFDCTVMNVDRATIKGISLYAAHTYNNNLHVWASADFMNPKDDKTGKQLSRRAKHDWKVGAEYQWQQLGLGAEYQYLGKRYDDAQNSTEKRLSSYSLVNLTASYAFYKDWEAQLRWNNIFDKNYSNTYGYNMPGSNVFLNLSWRM